MKHDDRENFLLVLGIGKGVNDEIIYHNDIPKIVADAMVTNVKAFPASINPFSGEKHGTDVFTPEWNMNILNIMELELSK
jgi:hypothetical protein